MGDEKVGIITTLKTSALFTIGRHLVLSCCGGGNDYISNDDNFEPNRTDQLDSDGDDIGGDDIWLWY